MNAYRLNEYEWYAGSDVTEAILTAMAYSELTREEVVDVLYCTGEPEDPSLEVWADEDRTEKTTIGAILAKMDGPGFICGTE